ncbi:hypothetical protein HDR61_02845 [bacterium]|nr:hypothetical protein [bacterium]
MYTKKVIYSPYDWGRSADCHCKYDNRILCTHDDMVNIFVALALAWRPGMAFPHNADWPQKCILDPNGCPRYLAAQQKQR